MDNGALRKAGGVLRAPLSAAQHAHHTALVPYLRRQVFEVGRGSGRLATSQLAVFVGPRSLRGAPRDRRLVEDLKSRIGRLEVRGG
jgi:hypothetical protein